MKKTFINLILLLLFTLVIGCGEDNNGTGPNATIRGVDLLSLENGKQLHYIQNDTVISIDPIQLTTSDTIVTFVMSGSGDDWIITNNIHPIINLKITTNAVLQNGQWFHKNDSDSLIYYPLPPIILEQSLELEQPWQYYTPFYFDSLNYYNLPVFIANFGFIVEKQYSGREVIITPGGEFNAYRYDLRLFADGINSGPIAESIEYYSPGTGLLKLELRTGPLHRVLTLISTD